MAEDGDRLPPIQGEVQHTPAQVNIYFLCRDGWMERWWGRNGVGGGMVGGAGCLPEERKTIHLTSAKCRSSCA